MKARKKCVYIFILLLCFVIYVNWDERRTLFNFRRAIVTEALQNYESPVLASNEDKANAFLDKIRDSTDEMYGNKLKSGTKTNDDFMNEDYYSNPEVAQDIKYFNNATHLLIGMKLNSGDL